MIDLHLHTTASDGTLSPAELVTRAKAAGLTTIGVADHDTMAAVPELEALTREAGLDFVPGIEITAVWNAKDIHILGYFLDCRARALAGFLDEQRDDRERRAREIGTKLAALGAAIDMERLVHEAMGRTIARPIIARALVAAGHVRDVQEAFDRYLAEGQPAYSGRIGATPRQVIDLIAREGGISAFAHPGVTKQDGLLSDLAGQGLRAVEVYHTEHSPDETSRYLAFARERGLLVTGGSDFHGDGVYRAVGLGTVGLPADDFDQLRAAAGSAARQA